jgi:hypothetical protein
MQRGRVHTSPAPDQEQLAEHPGTAGLCFCCGEVIKSEDDLDLDSMAHNCPETIAAMEPRVGIFFVSDGKLFLRSTAVSQATPYGDCITFEGGHPKFWDELIAAGEVPDTPYEEPPRGRVMLDTTAGKFHIYADRCIAQDVGIMSEIKALLNLSPSTKVERDGHYSCKICQGRNWVSLLEA